MKSRPEKPRYCALPARTVRRSLDDTESPRRDREAGRDVRRLIAAKAPPPPDLSAAPAPCQKPQDLSLPGAWTPRPWRVPRIAPAAEYQRLITLGGWWWVPLAYTDGTLGRLSESRAGADTRVEKTATGNRRGPVFGITGCWW